MTTIVQYRVVAHLISKTSLQSSRREYRIHVEPGQPTKRTIENCLKERLREEFIETNSPPYIWIFYVTGSDPHSAKNLSDRYYFAPSKGGVPMIQKTPSMSVDNRLDTSRFQNESKEKNYRMLLYWSVLHPIEEKKELESVSFFHCLIYCG
jgi:hypothetical protein